MMTKKMTNEEINSVLRFKNKFFAERKMRLVVANCQYEGRIPLLLDLESRRFYAEFMGEPVPREGAGSEAEACNAYHRANVMLHGFWH